jgi:hypothetical protein
MMSELGEFSGKKRDLREETMKIGIVVTAYVCMCMYAFDASRLVHNRYAFGMVAEYTCMHVCTCSMSPRRAACCSVIWAEDM